MDNLRITFVGSGDYCNHGGRAQQAILFEYQGQGLMVDFGANTCAQLKKMALGYDRFQTILLTHFHGDHIGGLPYMIAELNNLKEGNLITIVGPGKTKDHVDTLCRAMGYGPAKEDRFDFADIMVDSEYVNSMFSAKAVAMVHCPESLGYRLKFGPYTVAVTGDTKWCSGIVKLADKADLLICDVNREKGLGNVHISLEELLLHRSEINADQILPVHIDDLGRNCPFPPVYDGVVYELSHDGLMQI